jgi:hypothetical protein
MNSPYLRNHEKGRTARALYKEHRHEAARLAKAGYTIEDLMERFNTSRDGIVEVNKLLDFGLPRRKPGRPWPS